MCDGSNCGCKEDGCRCGRVTPKPRITFTVAVNDDMEALLEKAAEKIDDTDKARRMQKAFKAFLEKALLKAKVKPDADGFVVYVERGRNLV